MDVERLADEISRINIENAKALSHFAGVFCQNGEAGVLLWLGTRVSDTYAVDIIDHFGLTPGRVANIVKSLERRALIERFQDTKDQRKSRIFLTGKGKTLSGELYARLSESNMQLIKLLGEDDTLHLIRILKRCACADEKE